MMSMSRRLDAHFASMHLIEVEYHGAAFLDLQNFRLTLTGTSTNCVEKMLPVALMAPEALTILPMAMCSVSRKVCIGVLP